ncbi:Endo-1,3(4)-beta-glucanase 1 [Smittium mucronatum]|uniref:glucan endo-1,3-beta-D-glucosidase n=1 Tax=Smittium mucronatum TaxID=133383 RepID=A0A1R0GME0_9FUNG|nr:Endo-1,3(4)-beta-glucanase 1 [Smittium mucronatum]
MKISSSMRILNLIILGWIPNSLATDKFSDNAGVVNNSRLFVRNAVQASELPFIIKENEDKPNELWGNLKGPYPTNKWWLNLVMDSGNGNIFPYPYKVSASSSGLSFGQGKVVTEGSKTKIAENNPKWVAMCQGGFESRRILRYDDLTVDLIFESVLNEKKYNMTSYIMKGSPYMTFKYQSVPPRLKYFGSRLKALEQKDENKKSFIAQLMNGEQWAIFSTTPLDLAVDDEAYDSTILYSTQENFSGFIRMAIIPEDKPISSFQTLLSHSNAIPISGNVLFEGNSIIHVYGVFPEGQEKNLLMLSLIHHREYLENPKYVDRLGEYKTLRGDMLGIVGNTWKLVYSETSGKSVDFIHKREIPEDYASLMISSLKSENIVKVHNRRNKSIYFKGKQLARLARLVLIAKQLGQTERKNQIIGEMKIYFDKFFGYKTANPLYYDRTWGGLCSKDGLENSEADFGNGIYNDHNFHYGYYCYALYAIIQSDGIQSHWVQSHLEKIKFLVMEFTSSSNNRFFTKFRHMDFYDGNSWVNGFFVFDNSRNTESTSESVNSYYSAYLLYSCLGMEEDAHIADLLLTSEIISAQNYWQIKDDSVYKKPFTENKVVGVLWENSAEYTTWFGNNPEYIYGIQMIPFTPISFKLLNKEWIRDAWPTIKQRTLSPGKYISQEWEGIIKMAGALVDDSINENDFNALWSYDDGNSKTNALWWIFNCKTY